MEIFEVEQQETLTRKEVATRFRRLANMLAGDDEEITFERGGMTFSGIDISLMLLSLA